MYARRVGSRIGPAALADAKADGSAPPGVLPVLEESATRCLVPFDLGPCFDADAISWASNPGDGALNCWGNSIPADELPPAGEIFRVGAIPFVMPPTGDGEANTLVCRRQLLELDAVPVDWIHVLATAERRTEDVVLLHFATGAVDPEHVRVSDFWPAQARFGERLAVQTTSMHYPHHVQKGLGAQIWAIRIPVPRREDLAAIRLPDNHAIHVFALTLELRP